MMLARSLPVLAAALLLSALLAGGCAGTPEVQPMTGPCPLPVLEPRHASLLECSPMRPADQMLDQLFDEVAVLERQGKQALRQALEVPGPQIIGGPGMVDPGPPEALRNALLLMALGENGDDAKALTLLETYLARSENSPGEALLARLLRDQIRARQALRANLSGARSERDALQRQLEELKAIEQQIRDRTRTPDVELQQ